MIITEKREIALSELYVFLQNIPVCRSVRYHAIGQILKDEFSKGILTKIKRYDNGREVMVYRLNDEEE